MTDMLDSPTSERCVGTLVALHSWLEIDDPSLGGETSIFDTKAESGVLLTCVRGHVRSGGRIRWGGDDRRETNRA
jgi:hypothetical protein